MKFLDRCDAAGIRNPGEGAFPRGILPTDIDGEVELNGRFLRFEFKHESRIRNGAVTKGQHILFERLVSTGFHTVFLIGKDDDGEITCLQIYAMTPAKKVKVYPLIEATQEHVRDMCKRWAGTVQATPLPFTHNLPAA